VELAAQAVQVVLRALNQAAGAAAAGASIVFLPARFTAEQVVMVIALLVVALLRVLIQIRAIAAQEGQAVALGPLVLLAVLVVEVMLAEQVVLVVLPEVPAEQVLLALLERMYKATQTLHG
jgi:hypothetical protein